MRNHIGIFLISAITLSFSQHFNLDIPPTGEYQLIIFQESISGLNDGDEIGVFDLNGIQNSGDCSNQIGELLVGAATYDNSQFDISAIGSLDYCAFGGNQFAGYVEGNPVVIKIYKPDLQVEFTPTITYQSGSGEFGDLLLSISELSLEGFGCTDPEALNYDPDAMYDDGSCQYESVINPPINLIATGNDGYITLQWENGNSIMNRTDVSLWISDVTDSNIEISMLNTTSAVNFQFDIIAGEDLGASFGDASGGIAETLGYNVVTNQNGLVLGYSLSLTPIPPGEYVLTNVEWTHSGMNDYLHLDNAIFPGENPYTELSVEYGEAYCYGNCVGLSNRTYNVYRDGDLYFEGVNLTMFNDGGLGYSESHCYTVTATDGNVESDHSNEACATTMGSGCTDPLACNYDPESLIDGDCWYPEDEGWCDCEGNISDCAGICGGTAYFDDCGICDDNPENDDDCIPAPPQDLTAEGGVDQIQLEWQSPDAESNRNMATLYISGVTEEFIEISMSNDVNIYGVQFDIDANGLQPVFNSIEGVSAFEAGFELFINTDGLVLGYDMNGDFIPPGNSVLLYVYWNIVGSDAWVTLDDIIVAGFNGDIVDVNPAPPFCYGICDQFYTYNIYRDNFLIAGGIAGLSYTDNSLEDTETHEYYVTAFDGFFESAPSNSAFANIIWLDCNGTPEGSAVEDACGYCCQGETGIECSYWQDALHFGGAYDCYGECDGDAYNNECGCVGGESGLEADFCYGCTDPEAENYNPDALFECNGDNSCCVYPPPAADADISFGSANYSDNTLELIINTQIEISSFDIDLNGMNIIDIFGGLSAEFGYDMEFTDIQVHGEPQGENILPETYGVLLNLVLDNPGFSQFFITQASFLDANGAEIVVDYSDSFEWTPAGDCEESDMNTDCNGVCFDDNFLNWHGDGYCDNGSYGINLFCEGWDYDLGDCSGEPLLYLDVNGVTENGWFSIENPILSGSVGQQLAVQVGPPLILGDGGETPVPQPQFNDSWQAYLSVSAYEDNVLEISLNNTEYISGFQFNIITGFENFAMIGGSGGSAGDAGFMISTNNSGLVLGFSLTGSNINDLDNCDDNQFADCGENCYPIEELIHLGNGSCDEGSPNLNCSRWWFDDGDCEAWEEDDCAGVPGGEAFVNECGCVGGTTGLEPDFCYGCLDPNALNFNENFTIYDGSCEYCIYGDMNNDGLIDILDYVALLNYITLGGEYEPCYDWNGDGSLDQLDASDFYQFVMNGGGNNPTIEFGYTETTMCKLDDTVLNSLEITISHDDGINITFLAESSQIEEYDGNNTTTILLLNVNGNNLFYTDLPFDIVEIDAATSQGEHPADLQYDACEIPIPVFGCSDPDACNYNPEVTTDDGSCDYPDCNGDCFGDAYENECGCVGGNTGLEPDYCYGCTDPEALNYDMNAFIDDGSCAYDIQNSLYISNVTDQLIEIFMSNDGDVYGFQFNLAAEDMLDAEFGTAGGGSAENNNFMLTTIPAGTVLGFSLTGDVIPAGNAVLCYVEWTHADTTGFISIENAMFTSAGGSQMEVDNGDPFQFGEEGNDIYGCTDPGALNYNPYADEDDGSCEYCTPGDVDNDGNIDIMDVIAILNFLLNGNEINNCADVNQDGEITIIDIVSMINFILGNLNPGYADMVNIFYTENTACMEAVGSVGSLEFILAHDEDFQIYITAESFTADYHTEGDTTTVLIFSPIGTELFVSVGNFTIVEVNATSNNSYLDVDLEFGDCVISSLILGCTDPDAVNFNPEAEVNDNSCIYTENYPNWQFNMEDYSFAGLILAEVVLNEDASESGYDQLAAFSGDEIRGLSNGIYDPETESCIYQILVFSNQETGDTLSFQYFNLANDMVYDLNEVINFESGMELGSVENPLQFTNLYYDCAGIVNGGNSLDVCDICDDDPANDSYYNSVDDFGGGFDCGGVCFGTAYIDEDGYCIAPFDPDADLWPYNTDCNDVVDGSAFVDECGICSGGNTGHEPNICSETIGEDGICWGEFSGPDWNECGECFSTTRDTDCAGVCFGEAYENECGCVGGITELDPAFCYGCTDPSAANYDSGAFIDDGSCDYTVQQLMTIQANRWNNISANVSPYDPGVENIFNPATTLIVRDDQADYYIPVYDVNQIGSVEIGRGYEIYLSSENSTDMVIVGTQVEPGSEIIELQPLFWNNIAYLPESPMSVSQLFDGTPVLIIKDSEGHYYIPEYNVNTIDASGGMQPGKGYFVYITGDEIINFMYSDNILAHMNPVGTSDELSESLCEYYYFISSGKPYPLIITDIVGDIETGDEIAVLVHDQVVGALKIENTGWPKILTAWQGFDEFDIRIPGWLPGDELTFQMWDESENMSWEILPDRPIDTSGGVPFGEFILDVKNYLSIPENFELVAAYPNPFNAEITIEYTLADDVDISITIFDLLGRPIAKLVNTHQATGTYVITWQAEKYTSGIYFLNMTAADYQKTQRIILLK